MRTLNNKMLNNIYKDIKKNFIVNEIYLANKYLCSERTIRRYIKILKDNKLIKLEGSGTKRIWKCIDKVWYNMLCLEVTHESYFT